jgi:PIN domain nuclease of toxin-antitoxin system
MDYLLDTHSFLWAVFEPKKLSKSARDSITDPKNRVVVSSITFWEIALKSALGKLELVNCLPDELPATAIQMGLELIDLEADVAANFYRLPKQFHKDPFDRMIIWLAIQKKFILISKDNQFNTYSKYGLKTAW